MPRMVKCVRLGQELPGIAYQPFNNELGQRIFASVSQQAWMQWISTPSASSTSIDWIRLPGGPEDSPQSGRGVLLGSGGAPPAYVP